VKRTILLFLSLILLFLGEPSRSGGAKVDGPVLAFGIADLKVSGVVDGVMPADLNGDGRKDLLVLHSASELFQKTRYLSVFYQWGDGFFSSAADQTWEADSLAQAVEVEEGSDSHAASILYLRRDGLWRYPYEERRFREEGERVAAHRTFFVSRSSEDLMPLTSLLESDTQGVSWVTLPGTDGVVIYRGTEQDFWEPFDSVAYDLVSNVMAREVHEAMGGTMSLRQTLSMPWVSRGSLREGSPGDLFLLYEERMEGYEFSTEGFNERMVMTLDYDLAKGLEEQRSSYVLQPALLDLDADGLSDLVVTRQEGGGIGGFLTRLDVYRGPLSGREGNAPSQRITFEDAMSYFITFVDLDGDGRMELAVPVVKLGLFDIVRILTTKTLKVTVHMYRLDETGLYEPAPRWVHEIHADIDFKEGAGEVVGKLVNANGDGDKDLAITLEPKRLSVFLGKSGSVPRFFERKPSVELETHSDVEIEASDLTGDGKDELIATFGTSLPGMGIVRIYLNRTGFPQGL
jgi:hypothetical protein